MPWNGHTRFSCRVCHKTRLEVGPLSARGKCSRCGLERSADEQLQLAEHRGPYFEHWRERMAASVGGVLLDGARDES